MRRVSLGFSGEWADLLGDVRNATAQAALTFEQFGDGTDDSGFWMDFFHATQDDAVEMRFQLNHDILIPAQVRFHVHLVPCALAETGVSDIVRWTYYWTIASVNGNVPRAGWTSATISKTIAPTDLYKHVVHSIVNIDIPAGTPASSFVLIKLVRPGSSDAADTYSVNKARASGQTQLANLGFLGLDLHVQRSRAGTTGEFA